MKTLILHRIETKKTIEILTITIKNISGPEFVMCRRTHTLMTERFQRNI